VKNKFILVFFTAALFGSIAVFAADNNDAVAKKPVAKKSVSNLATRTSELENQIRTLTSQIDQMQNKGKGSVPEENNKLQFHSLLEMYAHGPAVVTSPSFGVRRPDDNYSDLMSKLSSMNEDLVLLGLRKKMDNYAKEHGIPIPTRPIIALSGAVEGQITYNSNDKYTATSKSDINLNTAEVDVIAEAGPWATSAMIINYVDKADAASADSITRWNNSRIRLDRGWLTLGQLNKAPVYFTIGQVYAPFGSYSSNMVTTPSTQILGRVKDRMVVLGYNQFGIYAQAYTYAGETESTGAEAIKHSGLNLGYRVEHENFAIAGGVGAIGNLAESQGMQEKIFGKRGSSESMASRVYGLNGHIKTTFYNTVTLLAEYVRASKAFDPTDLKFNGAGAKPQALQIEGSVKFKVAGKPSFLFAGYGLTKQALALEVPKQTYFVGYSASLIKYTLASLEYRHDVGYNLGDTSTSTGFGRKISYPSSTNPPTRRHNNKITAELGVYF
jgi:ribosomal protein L18